MPGTKVTFDMVRELGLALPDVEEGTMYGSPALKVHGKLLTCLAIHKSAEPQSLAVRIDFDQRSGLLADEPETYYVTDHYVNYPVVLVRLTRIRIDQLRDLLGSAWRFVTAPKSRIPSRPAVKGNVKTATRHSGKPRHL
jgi:hypothetical protein